MTSQTSRRVRALRHGAAATGIVLLVCLAVGVFSWLSYLDHSDEFTAMTGKAQGEVAAYDDGAVTVRWSGGEAVIPFATGDRVVGKQTEIRYNPADPAKAVIPGADLIVDAGRASSMAAMAAAVAVLVVLAGAWRIATALRAARLPGRKVMVRRIRVQRGLMVRSFIEIEERDEKWIPVFYDPVLATLPTPAEVTVHGDRAITVDGTTIYPSGRTTHTHPKGRRTDNPAVADVDVIAPTSLGRQFRVDAALVIPAPFVGLFWAFVDSSGFVGWLTATAVFAAVGLWWGSFRGSDPS